MDESKIISEIFSKLILAQPYILWTALGLYAFKIGVETWGKVREVFFRKACTAEIVKLENTFKSFESTMSLHLQADREKTDMLFKLVQDHEETKKKIVGLTDDIHVIKLNVSKIQEHINKQSR